MSELVRPFMVSVAPEVQWTRVTPYASSDWSVDAVNGVGKIAKLPANWDSYGSQPLTGLAKTCAISLAMEFGREDLPAPRVVPISGGGLQFEFTYGPRSLELEVLPDGTIEFLRIY